MTKETNGENNTAPEIEKSKIHVIVDIIDYVSNAVVSKTILRKTTGNVTAMSFDQGEELGTKIHPFDMFIQIIEGTAEVMLDKERHNLRDGTAMVIPAHKEHGFNANTKFKMISTIIKSGYEDHTIN